MPQQKFTSIKSYIDQDFHASVKIDEFWYDTFNIFGRVIKNVSTTNDHLVITLDEDIPNNTDPNTSYFEPEYYGFIRG